METAGLAVGVVGLAGQLFTVGLECYKILSDTRGVGADHDHFVWQLNTERLRLEGCEKALDLDRSSARSDYRYRYAVGTLARIVSLFASADSLSKKYGIQATTAARSKSNSRKNTSGIPTPLPGLDPRRVGVLEDPSVLEDVNLVPGLGQEIVRLEDAAKRFQQILPLYKKLQWVVRDKPSSMEFITRLKEYNDGLLAVLSITELAPAQHAGNMSPSFSKFNVPMQLPGHRNQSFCGRDDLLEKIHSILRPKTETTNNPAGRIQLVPRRRIAVLHGLGGMGKSQIATEYAYRHSVGSTYTSIFWLDATSQASLVQSTLTMAEQIVSHYATRWGDSSPDFAQIGVMLGLPGHIEPTGRIKPDGSSSDVVLGAMKRWLSNVENKDWLVIFDNNDDIDSVKLNSFSSTCDSGSIIITTRRSDVEHLGDMIEVEGVEETAGIAILLKSAGKSSNVAIRDADNEEAAMIANKLGYLPLALVQAGGYISTKQIPLSDYMPLYLANFKNVASKSHRGLAESYRNDTIFTTWKISFDSLPLPAYELLLLCAFLGNGDIPEELLYRGRETIPQLFQDDELADNALEPLLSYSLVKRKGAHDLAKHLSFHPLVLEWARASQETVGRQRYSGQAVSLVSSTYKGGFRTTDDWAFGLRILTHIDISLQNIRKELCIDVLPGVEAADILENLGNYFLDHGQYTNAEEILQKALAICQKDPNVVVPVARVDRIRFTLGRVYTSLGHNEKALEIEKQVLASQEKVLGKEHTNTLRTASNMTNSLANLGRHEEALEIKKQVLASQEKVLGKEHPDTLRTASNMTNSLANLGRHEEALEIYKQVLASQEKVLGKEHPNTLGTARNMAITLSNIESMHWKKRIQKPWKQLKKIIKG